MAKANVILHNSILWNLREVTKLAEKVKNHCGDVDCTSWRYPLTSCSELEIYKLLQSNKNLDSYTYILELTYDRLLYLFNLIIKYLESNDTLGKFRPNKNVCRPKSLSLASVLHMIWDRIQAQAENVNRTSFTESTDTLELEKDLGSEKDLSACRSSISTQSDVCCISVCSCCEMVQHFMTELVIETEKVLEKQNMKSAISDERKIIKEQLDEMTSWSAMSRWLAAIIKDFTAISERVDTVTTNSRNLRHRLDSGDRKMKHRIQLHEEDTRKFQERLKDYEGKMQDLKLKLKVLNEENTQIKKELEEKDTELIDRESKFEKEMKDLKRSYENKLKDKREKKLKKDREREEELKRRLIEESKELSKLDNQNKTLEEIIAKLKKDIDVLNVKTSEDQNSFLYKIKDLEIKIDTLKKENLSLNSMLEEKQKTIKDYSLRIMEAFPELNGAKKPKYTASGNPEIDMENQIEANKLRIKHLQQENENLQRTLDKIKLLKG